METAITYCDTQNGFLYLLYKRLVSQRPLDTPARVQARCTLYEISGVQSVVEKRISQSP